MTTHRTVDAVQYLILAVCMVVVGALIMFAALLLQVSE